MRSLGVGDNVPHDPQVRIHEAVNGEDERVRIHALRVVCEAHGGAAAVPDGPCLDGVEEAQEAACEDLGGSVHAEGDAGPHDCRGVDEEDGNGEELGGGEGPAAREVVDVVEEGILREEHDGTG